MYQKVKVIVCMAMFMISGFGLSAQTDTIVSNISNVQEVQHGEIVMTKSELISFLEKIAEARKQKVEFDLENAYLENLNSQYSRSSVGVYAPTRAAMPLSSNIPVQNMSRDDLMREIDVLNSRLNYMSTYGGGYGSGYGGGGSTTFITSPGNAPGGGYYPYQTQSPLIGGMPLVAPTGDNSELRWKIDSLQRQVNMLSAPSTSLAPDTSSFPVISIQKKDEILRLKREIDQAQDSLILRSTLTPEAKEIVKQYGTTQMRIYFENDASDVSLRYYEEVERAAILLKKNLQLGVVLKGFASPVGNPKYNFDLSMRRNEAVKRMLIEYGVFPDQISSVFYGEDKTSSVSEARRVDIKFIIK